MVGVEAAGIEDVLETATEDEIAEATVGHAPLSDSVDRDSSCCMTIL